jgi:hypothetical protein
MFGFFKTIYSLMFQNKMWDFVFDMWGIWNGHAYN